MQRRFLLVGSSAIVGLAACSTKGGAPPASAATDAPIADIGSGPVSAVIEHQGNTYRYDETAGTDLGDYVDPQKRFVQGCVRVTHDQLPMTVFFRRDRGSNRAEAVFELGRLWSKAPPANLDDYHVTIIRGDKTVFATDVPHHYWFSRWRWQSGPRPVTAKVSALMASGLLPHFDNSVHNGTARPTRPQTYKIMELAGLTRSMPMTGERDDIGPVTEQQADFICTGRTTALDTLLAQAEAAGTIPWHFRDERTDAPLDTIHYTKATLYSRETGDPFIARTETGMHVDSAHQPAVAYLPYLLTGDPYHLETLQFQVTFNVIESPPEYRYRTQQPRGQAWSLRTLGQAAQVTPDTLPHWLLPRSYFRELLNRQRDWLTHDFVDSNEIIRSVFRTTDQTFLSRNDGAIEAGTVTDPWQEEFQAFIFGWLVQMGHVDWEAVFRWKLGSTTARTDGKSGWIRAVPTLYRQLVREHRNSPWVQSWGESWQMNQTRQDLHYADPNRLEFNKGGDIVYPSYTRAALAMGARLGVAEAKPCFEWLDPEIRRHLTGGVRLDYKWSVS
jgi:hypothetical protein